MGFEERTICSVGLLSSLSAWASSDRSRESFPATTAAYEAEWWYLASTVLRSDSFRMKSDLMGLTE